MDLRHLRYFAVVAEELHVGRAAARLFVAQPALSRQLKDIEDELGVLLFTRVARGVALTPEGTRLAEHARELLARAGAALDRALRAAAGLHGSLNVGVGRAMFWQDAMLRVGDVVRERLPHLEINFREVEGGPTQWEQVAGGQFDIAIGVEPPPIPGIQAEPFFNATLDCALLPAAHPLAARGSIQPAELADLPLLWGPPDKHPSLSGAMLDEVNRLAITSPHDFTYSGPHAIWLAVAAGRGWTPAPGFMRQWAPDGTVAVSVADLQVPVVQAVIWRADDDRPALRMMLKVLRAVRDESRRRAAVAAAGAGAAKTGPPRRESGSVPVGLELRHLRAMAAVVVEPSLGRAATRLDLTQPALSQQIRDLEEEVGTQLVERTARGVQPTPAGESLAADATRILLGVEEMLAEMSRARRLLRRELIMGGMEMAATNPVVLALLRLCRERHPEVNVITTVLKPRDLIAGLHAASVDVALVPLGTGREEPFERLPLTSDVGDSALLAPNHPLAARQRLAPAELAVEPFLFITPALEPEHYARALGAFADIGLRMGTVFSFDSLQTTWELARQGKGWTIGLRRHQAQPPEGLVAVPVDGLAIPWGLDLLWRPGEADAVIADFVEAAREVAGAGGAVPPTSP